MQFDYIAKWRRINKFANWTMSIMLILILGLASSFSTDSLYHFKNSIGFTFNLFGSSPLPMSCNSFGSYKILTVDADSVQGTQVNFPVLISHTDPDLSTIPNGGDLSNANGWDIQFTNWNGEIIFDHQIESYDPATGKIEFWVKVDTLFNTNDTEIRIYYGDPSISTDPSSTNTWQSNYKGVWHLDSDNNDETSTGTNLGNSGSGNQSPGVIADGQNFDFGDNLNSGVVSALNINGDLTLETWLFLDDINPVPGQVLTNVMFSNGGIGDGNSANNYNYFFNVVPTGNLQLAWEYATGGAAQEAIVSLGLLNAPLSRWTHLAVTRNVATNTVKFYQDGDQLGADVFYINDPFGGSNATLMIAENQEANNLYALDGKLDEPRISNLIRSSDWIKTSYRSMTDPATFYSIGTTAFVPLCLTESHINVSCNGLSDGSIDLTINGGIGPFMIDWDTDGLGDFDDPEDQSSLSAGTYKVIVKDSDNQQDSLIIEVTEPLVLTTVSSAIQNVSCFGGSDGQARTVPSGGVSPYTYMWDDASTNDTIFNVSAGWHRVTVTDDNLCIVVDSVDVSQPLPIVTNMFHINSTSCNVTDGSAYVFATGGFGSLTYSWSDLSTDDTLLLASPIWYFVTVTDESGCTAIDSIKLLNGCLDAVNDTVQVNFEQAKVLSILLNDIDESGDLDSSSVDTTGLAGPINGLILNIDTVSGDIIYLPDLGYTGLDSFQYSVCDSMINCDTAWVLIEIYCFTDPLANIISGSAFEDANGNGIRDPGEIIFNNAGLNLYEDINNNGILDGIDSLITSATTDVGGAYNFTVYPDFNSLPISTTARINRSSDDAEEVVGGCKLCEGPDKNPGCIALTKRKIHLGKGNKKCGDIISGFKFNNLGIPKGATIISASIDFISDGSDNKNANLAFKGVVSDFSEFALQTGDISSRPMTSSATNWSNVPAWSKGDPYTTPDLSNVVQEIIDAPSWDQDSSIIIVISGDEKRKAASYDKSPDKAAILNIEYTLVTFQNYIVEFDVSSFPTGTFCLTSPLHQVVTFTQLGQSTCSNNSSLLFTLDHLELSHSKVDATCFMDTNGSIDLTVDAGLGPFQYDWDNDGTGDFDDSEDLSNLTPGIYKVTVVASNGCLSTQEVIINGGSEIMTLFSVIKEATCNGDTDAEATVIVSGGTAPYMYSWNNGQTTDTIINLNPGWHAVTVTDNLGCTAQDSFELIDPTFFDFSVFVINHVTCNGLMDGAAYVSLISGEEPLTYLWSGSETTDTIANKGPGWYYVTVTDDNGCIKEDSIEITEPPVLIAVTSILTDYNGWDISCFGQADGKGVVTVGGGTLIYNYNWTGGQTTDTLFNASAGKYYVTVSDGGTCVLIDSLEFSEPGALTGVMSNVKNPSCTGDSDGIASVSASGGVIPYTYLWEDNSTADTLRDVGAGWHYVTVTDNNLCVFIDSVELIDPPLIMLSEMHTDISCYGGSDGTIDLTVSGGTGSYQYDWDNDGLGDNDDPQDLANLTLGSYKVIVTDIMGCKDSLTIVLTEPSDLVLTEIHVDESCGGLSDGSIDLTVSGGTTGYTFDWDNDGLGDNDDTEDLTGLLTGTYKVIVTDALGCKDSLNVVLSTPINDYRIVGEGYGFNRSKTGTVGQDKNATGIPNSTVATIDAAGGALDIELSLTIEYLDTIWFGVASQDANLADYEVSVSIDDATYVDVLTMDVTGTTIIEDYYIVTNPAGAHYIRIEKNGATNNKDVKLDYVRYYYSECVPVNCTSPFISVTKIGNATGFDAASTATNDAKATGAPNDDGASVNSGKYLTVDFGEVVPQGGWVYLYMARDRNTNIDVSSSLDNISFGNLQSYSANFNHPNYQQFRFQVSQVGGIQYVKIDGTDEEIFVDAVEYNINICQDNTPIALPDSTYILEDHYLIYNVVHNDIDLQGDSLTVNIVSGPDNGMASVTDSSISYTPDADFSGIDTIFYSVCDDTPLCDTTYYLITVTPDGCDPGEMLKIVGTGYGFDRLKTGTVGGDKNVLGYPDGVVSTIETNSSLRVELSQDVLSGDTIWFSVAAQGATLSDYEVSISQDGTNFFDAIAMGVTGTSLVEQFYKVDGGINAKYIRFSKNGNTNGQDLKVDFVNYHLRQCDPIDCILPLVGVLKEGFTPAVEEQSGVGAAASVTGSPDKVGAQVGGGDFLTVDLGELVPAGGHIYLYMTRDNNSSSIDVQSSFDNTAFANLQSYTPLHAGAFQQFNYEVLNPMGVRYIKLDNTSQRIDVDAIGYGVNYCEDGTPVAVYDSTGTPEDTPVDYNVLLNDFDLQGDSLTISIIINPTNGIASVTSDSIITYTPDLNFYGIDTLYYSACDPTPLCDTTYYIITVDSINDPPVAIEDYDVLSINTVKNIDVQFNDYDVEGHAFVTSIITPPVNGIAVTVNGDSILYTPNLDYVGNDSLIYKICDNGTPALCDTATAYITIVACDYPIPLTPDADVCISHSVDIDGTPTGGTGIYISHSWSIISGGTSSGAYLLNTSSQVVTLDADTATVGTVYIEYIVTDSKGCPGIDTIEVSIHPELTLSESHIDVSCNATSNGSIDLNIVYCALPITIDWDYNGLGDTDDPEDPSGLGVGFYEVFVTDGAGGSDSLTVEIVEKVFTISETHTDVTCNGASDGSIDITPSEGSAPISYAWFKDGSSFGGNTQDLSSLDTGVYKVVATDNLGCQDSLEIIIIENMLMLEETHTDVTTFDGIDGSIDLTVNFGTAPYDYDWDYNGLGDTDDPEDPESLIKGLYKVTVTDALGCQDTISVFVDQPGPIKLLAETTFVSCDPGDDGTIDLTAEGTFNNVVNAPRTATFPTGSWIIGMDNKTQPGEYFSSSPSGYPNGNAGAGTMPFNLKAYKLANELLQNEIPLFWAIKSGKAKDGVDISVNAKRIYPTVQTVDSLYNFISGPLVIHPKDTAAARIIIDSLSSDNVHIYETTEFKSLEYRHKLTFKPKLLVLKNGNKADLHTGIYAVAGISNSYYSEVLASDIDLSGSSCFTFASEPHWKDGDNGATDYSNRNLEIPQLKLFVESGANFLAQCAGIEAYENFEYFHTDLGIVTHGTNPPYSNGQKAAPQIETGFSEEIFQIHGALATNPGGTFVGIHTATGSSYDPDLIKHVVKDPADSDVTDYDEVIGDIKITADSVFGGHIIYMGGHDWRKSGAGDEPYDSSFVNGLRVFLNAAILTPPIREDCPDLNFETITGPYTYNWQHIPGTDNPEDLTGLAPGTYTVIASDAVGHTSTLDVEISESPNLSITESHTNVSCNDAADGSIDLSVEGGIGPYSYDWSNGDTTQDLTGLTEGVYDVIVTDDKGCTRALSTEIGNSSSTPIFVANFEDTLGGNMGWSISAQAVEGNFEFDVPNIYTEGGLWMELDAIEGSQSLLTDNGNRIDVDTGYTSITSPMIHIPDNVAAVSLSFFYYFAHDDQATVDDYLIIELRDSADQSTLMSLVDEVGDTSFREAQWEAAVFDLSSLQSKTIYIYIEAADEITESIVEAAFDNMKIQAIEATISGFVWDDVDADGLIESGENGLSGIKVIAFDSVGLAVDSAITASDGTYTISGLLAATTYRIEFTELPANNYVSFGEDSHSSIQMIKSGDCTADLGLYTTAGPLALGNYVWYDEDQDGIQDPWESPLALIEVLLYQSDSLIGVDTTDELGFYNFGGSQETNILSSYTIEPNTATEVRIKLVDAKSNDGSITSITNLTTSNVNGNSQDLIDSDASISADYSTAIISFNTGGVGTTDYSFDFGFSGCMNVMDSVMYVGCSGDGYSITVGTSTYDENLTSGSDTLLNVYGCDSVVYTNLVFHPTYMDSIDYTGCEGDGYTIMVGDSTFNESNPSGTVVFQSKNGCDSSYFVNLQFNPHVVVDAGMLASPACSNVPIHLIDLGASISGGTTTGKWTTSGSGTFDNDGNFGGASPAIIYTPSIVDINRGKVILTLTSDDPPGPCEPDADPALIIISDLRCSQFPFTGY